MNTIDVDVENHVKELTKITNENEKSKIQLKTENIKFVINYFLPEKIIFFLTF